jgi:hypothetical protein
MERIDDRQRQVLRGVPVAAGLRILCAINPPEAIKNILDCLGLLSKSQPMCAAVLDSPLNF